MNLSACFYVFIIDQNTVVSLHYRGCGKGLWRLHTLDKREPQSKRQKDMARAFVPKPE